jgi:sodium-coupled neutral amino acid transporter 11
MVAFCITIGDTIPHVLAAVFPSLHETPVLWLLTDRRAAIVIFTLGMSYPLSLYRDIAMVCYVSNDAQHRLLTMSSSPKPVPSRSSAWASSL